MFTLFVLPTCFSLPCLSHSVRSEFSSSSFNLVQPLDSTCPAPRSCYSTAVLALKLLDFHQPKNSTTQTSLVSILTVVFIAARLTGASTSGGGSSISEKIAALSGNGKSSILPPSPSGEAPGSSTPPAPGKTTSGGGSNDVDGGNVADAKAGGSPRVSSGLAARMEAMKLSSSTPSNGCSSEKNDTVVEDASSSSASKMSPGLAARMGKAIPIPMPGGKRRVGEDGIVCCVFLFVPFCGVDQLIGVSLPFVCSAVCDAYSVIS